MGNERLRGAITNAGLSVQQLSERVGVDPKTIDRWIISGRLPHRTNRQRIAAALRVDESYLWPDALSDSQVRAASGAEIIDVYPNRGAVPTALWASLIENARERVDVLAFAASFLHDTIPDLSQTMLAKAGAGVQIRILLGDPDAASVAVRGEEEGIGSSLADRCRLSWKYLRPLLDTDGVEARMHAATVYASIFRFDDDVLVNHHLYGAPACNSPVLHLRRLQGGRLVENVTASFERTWDAAAPAHLEDVA